MSKEKTLLLASQDKSLIEGFVSELAIEIIGFNPDETVEAQISQHQPDLIVLDEALLRQLNEAKVDITNLVPVLLLTDKTDSQSLNEFVTQGVAEFLFTPLISALTLQCINRQLNAIEHHQTEQKLIRQTLKLHELGELVGLVSHEVASPLGNVNTAVSFLLESSEVIRASFDSKKLAATDLDKFLKRLHKALTMCVKNGGNAGGIIGSFRSVATNQCMENLNQFYLHRYVDDIILSLKSKLKKLPHEIHVVIGEGVEMTSYSGAFSQVITGLINKSIVHGFDDRVAGKIIINATLQSDETSGNTIVLNYIDNGKGMDAQTLEGLLSKKTDSPKNGLTSAMLNSIVQQQLQGTMSVSSKEGEGIHCTLKLPQRVS